MLPVTPSRKSDRISGHWDSNPDPRANPALTPLIRRLLYRLSYAPSKLVAVEGIEPTSLDYQSSALAVELHREVVDPTGLKPAPHGLKGRRSVTRAPGQKIGCGGRIRTFGSRINNPVPYQLGYATARRDGRPGGWGDTGTRRKIIGQISFPIFHLPFKRFRSFCHP